ncbi:hypothetical protein U1701_08995 [Sphingomonas sp. PB2P19]|uniref:hypothetical protein n=1 Tax=Sphingomonas rhamnosi TaxID=3096156 RepID=UPI002FC9A786
MTYSKINTKFKCSAEIAEALRDALAIKSSDFAGQASVQLGTNFTAHFPPTREGEPLSGLWDHFDPQRLGYAALEYRDPRIEVQRLNGGVVLSGNRACIDRAVEIIRHVCRDQLPIVIEWLSVDHHDRPNRTISKTALIGCDAVLTSSSAETAEQWRTEISGAEVSLNEGQSAGGSVNEDETGYVDVFLAEGLGLAACTSAYASPIDIALRAAGLGTVERMTDGYSDEACDDGSDVCNGIVAYIQNMPAAISLIRRTLTAAGCSVGCQVQYGRAGNILFETFLADGWSDPSFASVIDGGRAFEGDVWHGGVPRFATPVPCEDRTKM